METHSNDFHPLDIPALQQVIRELQPAHYYHLLTSPETWERYRALTGAEQVWPFGSAAVAGVPVQLNGACVRDYLYLVEMVDEPEPSRESLFKTRTPRIVKVIKLPPEVPDGE